MTAAGSPHGGQVGIRTALLAAGQLPPSLQPLPCPLETSKYNSLNSQHSCVHGASAAQQLQTAERDTGYTFVTIDGSLMKRDSKSILKEQDWGKVHLEARPLAIFTCRTCEMGLLTVPPSGLSQSYSKVRHKKHLK